MNAIEEGTRVASSFIAVMKREPLALALVAMNIGLLVLFYILMTHREHEIELIFADKKEVRELLSRCVVPP
jgi:hypothetical protein